MINILLIIAILVCFGFYIGPYKLKYYKDRILFFFNICPRCYSGVIRVKNYKVCQNCGKR